MSKLKAILSSAGELASDTNVLRALLLVAVIGTYGIYNPPASPTPGPTPTPDVEPDASRPIIAPAIVVAPVEEETAITVKALGPVRFASSGNVIIRQSGMTAYVMPLVEGEHKVLVTMDAGGWWWNRHDSAFVWIKIRTSKPPPVPPVDPFVSALQSAYVADGKPTSLPMLAAVYRNSGTIVNDAARKTPADVFTIMHRSIGLALKEADPDKTTIMPGVRKAIAVELDRNLPLGPASLQPLTDDMRRTIASQFARVTTALEGVK